MQNSLFLTPGNPSHANMTINMGSHTGDGSNILGMKKSNNLKIIHHVLFHPARFFREVSANDQDARVFFVSYGMPLMVLGAAGRMVRVMNQHALEGMALRWDQLSGVFLISLCGYLLSVWLGTQIIARLARAFRSRPDRDHALLLCIAAYTPFMLAQPLAAINTAMEPISLLGLIYAVFLFGKGLGPLLDTPAQKALGFTILGFFVLFGISFITILVLSALFIFGAS